MNFTTGFVIHKLLAPPASEVTFRRRGFYAGDPQARDYLEQIGCWFLTGLEYGMTVPGESGITARLETVPWEYRGFAYEGSSMALTILDGMLPAGGRRLDRFVAGPAAHQIYTAHVGAGWAMARLPRVLQSRVRPRDPLLRWLALDGYGFHEAYFRTPLVVTGQRPPRLLPGWRGYARSAAHVVDQGIGRALWFVCGADTDRLADTIAGFAPDRRPDLWSGVGLAAAYAGYRPMAGPDGDLPGSPAQDTGARLRELAVSAGRYLPDVAQGAAFAAKARYLAGVVTTHTEIAVRVLCGMAVAAAAGCTDAALPADTAAPDAYQTWRRQIRQRFTTIGKLHEKARTAGCRASAVRGTVPPGSAAASVSRATGRCRLAISFRVFAHS
jgi:enediyne biosynthesis protein E3